MSILKIVKNVLFYYHRFFPSLISKALNKPIIMMCWYVYKILLCYIYDQNITKREETEIYWFKMLDTVEVELTLLQIRLVNNIICNPQSNQKIAQ
jgi:hypothetical protein